LHPGTKLSLKIFGIGIKTPMMMPGISQILYFYDQNHKVMGNYRLIWIPRIITILYALFLMLFSFDAFDGDSGIFLKIMGFLVHNLPTVLLILVIILTWKRPLIAGILYLLTGLIFTIYLKTWQHGIAAFSFLSLPLFVVGGLFIALYFPDKNRLKQHKEDI
jgi:hypothetical protein